MVTAKTRMPFNPSAPPLEIADVSDLRLGLVLGQSLLNLKGTVLNGQARMTVSSPSINSADLPVALARTYGKGSVQTVVPRDNGDSIKLTTACYYTPSGESIQARGIRPDIVLRGAAARSLRESDLAGHLAAEGGADVGGGELIEGDEAIGRALEALKAGTASARARRRF